MAVNYLTIDDDTATYACAEGDHDEVLHSPGSAIGHLAHSSGIGIIGKSYRNAVHLVLQEFGYRNDALVTPFEVDGILDFACIIVSVRDTHSDSADLSGNACVCHYLGDGFCKFLDIRVYFIVCICADNGLCQHLAPHIHNTYLGGLSAYVDTDYIRHIHFVHIIYVLLFNRDICIDILAAFEGVVENVAEHCHYKPVACHVAFTFGDEFLDKRHHAAADNHHHEDT